jgi:hypothetical protein
MQFDASHQVTVLSPSFLPKHLLGKLLRSFQKNRDEHVSSVGFLFIEADAQLSYNIKSILSGPARRLAIEGV